MYVYSIDRMSQRILRKRMYGGFRRKQGALALARKNRAEIAKGREMHYNESAINTTATTTAGAVIYTSGVAVGDQVDDRTGNKVSSKEHIVRVWFEADVLSRMVRLIFFRDMQCQGALPVVTDVLSAGNIHSQFNWANRARFVILKDRYVMLPSNAGDVEAHKMVKFSTRRSMNLEYITDSEAIAGAGKGACFLLIISLTAGTADKVRYVNTIKFLP